MMDQRRRQHFLRQLEERRAEEAGDDAGELDEIGDLLDQRRVLLERHAAAEPARVQIEIARDAIAPLGMCRGRRSAPAAGPGTRRSCAP